MLWDDMGGKTQSLLSFLKGALNIMLASEGFFFFKVSLGIFLKVNNFKAIIIGFQLILVHLGWGGSSEEVSPQLPSLVYSIA